MALTEVNNADETVRRAEIARGLCELAAFLLDHPDLPTPNVHLVGYGRPKAIAAFVDGATDLDARTDDRLASWVDLHRAFAGLDVVMSCSAEHVGEVREVPSTKTELVAWSPVEIVARYTTADAEAEARGAHQVEIEEAGF